MASPNPPELAPRDRSEASLIPPTSTTNFEVPKLPRRNSSIDTAKPWDQPEFPLGEQQGNGHLTPAQRDSRSRSASEGGGSRSTIHDQGDGELLDLEVLDRKLSREDDNTSSSPPSPTHVRPLSESQRAASELELAQIGGTFPDHRKGNPQSEPSLTLEEPLAPHPPPPASSPATIQLPTFETAIRAEFKLSASRAGGQYLPIDSFSRIVTRDRVRQELSLLVPRGCIPENQLDRYTDQVWDPALTTSSNSGLRNRESRSSHEPRFTTRRKIFAILALIQRVEDIVRFIEERLHDNDLPFLLSPGENPGTLQLQRKSRNGKIHPITIVSSWPIHLLESFNNYQWKLLPPYFTLSTKIKPEVLHYSFEDGTVLPWIEDEEITSGFSGGFSDVWKVKIHPAHHNCSHDGPPNQGNPAYAIKRLKRGDREAFKAEVSSLKRFSSKDHLHLIKLLVTFELRKEFYFLFPCADGNLHDFWKRYDTVDKLPRDHKFAAWFSGQCLGLAKGLEMIHTFEVKPGEFLDIPASEQEKTHGRHGDLKPENILWFAPVGTYRPCETDKGSDMGVFKISDFGLSRFHRTASLRSGPNNGKSTPVSPTYRAPEFDIDREIDQSYDIWSLGCVLLEFIGWYVLGWEEVEKFSKKRVAEDNGLIKEDTFFNNVELPSKDGDKKEGEIGAQAKKVVYDEFQVLYQHERCSDFILDLLEFIESKLLRMRPKKRAKCGEIVDKLTALNILCQRNPKYCTERTRPAPLARANLSLLEPSALPYSDSQKKRIIRPRPPISLSERLNNLFEGHRSNDDPHSTRDSSKWAASSSPLTQVPRVTITEPTETPAINFESTPAIPGGQADDVENETTNNSSLPNTQDHRTSTPPGRTAPQPNKTSQNTQANATGKESTDQGSPSTTEDENVPQGQSEELHANGNGIVTSKPETQDTPRPRSEGKTPKRSSWGHIFCRWFPSRRKVESASGSQHEEETWTSGKDDERK